MNIREEYERFIRERNIEGSNKASSYIRALELLDGILRRSPLFGHDGFWSGVSAQEIDALYDYALSHQKEEGSVFLAPGLPPSYGRNGYYSAALRSFQEFLILHQHQQDLWDIYNTPGIDPAELGRKLARKKIKSIEKLVPDRDIDFTTKEGKDVVRKRKERVNQDFFREMILADYRGHCCVCGLNVPEVLRASHIVGWAEDAGNRMNPANGLCLSATYDAAFDRHLISFDEDYRLILSPALRDYYSNQAFKTHFLAYEGNQVHFPTRFPPDQTFLQHHREKLPAA